MPPSYCNMSDHPLHLAYLKNVLRINVSVRSHMYPHHDLGWEGPAFSLAICVQSQRLVLESVPCLPRHKVSSGASLMINDHSRRRNRLRNSNRVALPAATFDEAAVYPTCLWARRTVSPVDKWRASCDVATDHCGIDHVKLQAALCHMSRCVVRGSESTTHSASCCPENGQLYSPTGCWDLAASCESCRQCRHSLLFDELPWHMPLPGQLATCGPN